MKVDIGIIGALEEEVRSLIDSMSDHEVETVGLTDYHTGVIFGKRIAVAKCGVGKVFAAISTQTMIIKYSPRLIVNTGVGGALASGLDSGDVVIGSELCQHDMDTSPLGDPVGLVSGINKIYFESDSRAVRIIERACESFGYSYVTGRIASGDRFVASPDEKKRITSLFSASACEMEGAAVAQTAFVNNISFIVIRSISDRADGEASMSYLEFLPVAAEHSAKLTFELIKEY